MAIVRVLVAVMIVEMSSIGVLSLPPSPFSSIASVAHTKLTAGSPASTLPSTTYSS